MTIANDEMPRTWGDLAAETRALFQEKLAGLYNYPDNETAYNSLAPDKQEALNLLAGRLESLGLWQHVPRIVNVYGQGASGCTSAPGPILSRRFAHGKTSPAGWPDIEIIRAGFSKKRRRRAALQFLFIDPPADERK